MCRGTPSQDPPLTGDGPQRYPFHLAEVAELVDALGSGSSDLTVVGVRVPPSAPRLESGEGRPSPFCVSGGSTGGDEKGGKPAGGGYENASEERAFGVTPQREGPAPGTVGGLETQAARLASGEASRPRRFESPLRHQGSKAERGDPLRFALAEVLREGTRRAGNPRAAVGKARDARRKTQDARRRTRDAKR